MKEIGTIIKPFGFKRFSKDEKQTYNDDVYEFFDLDEMDFKLNLKGDHDFSFLLQNEYEK